MAKRFIFVTFFRNFVFGVEDSLVSTVGLLSGVAIAEVPRETILLTGIILIFVEAFSMAAGSFLSESSAESYETGRERTSRTSITSGVVMFISYFISGFIPLSAYLVWPVTEALTYSIFFSIVALFVLGVVGARISHTNVIKSGLRMIFVGGIAIAVGATAGTFISTIH